jgi:hypothetical protein
MKGHAAPSCLLYQELRGRGYQGSLRTLRRLAVQLRRDTAIPAAPPAPKAKEAASWILTPPGDLADGNRTVLAQITGRCAELNATGDLVREFADMLCHSAGTGRPSPPGSPSLTAPARSKATSIAFKMIKRQMYGRASFALLRRRLILHPA